MREYKEMVSTFCYFVAQIYGFAEKARLGQNVDERKLSYALDAVACIKPKLLDKKKQLGYDDELSFLEDNGFFGFRIIDGRFIGDKKKVKSIILPWIEQFPDDANHYQFEVACYLYYMAEPNRIDLYPNELSNQTIFKKQATEKKKVDIPYFFYQLGKRRELWTKRKKSRSA